tara:strand:+ start:13384 stop:13665 length:282 start_codon:yes stop_codon:yes gene_type:complete
MNFDVNNVVRSVAIVAVGLPLTSAVAVGVLSNLPEGQPESVRVLEVAKADLTRACLDYAVSKSDSKLEREAQNQIDDYFGGEVNHGAVCKFVL